MTGPENLDAAIRAQLPALAAPDLLRERVRVALHAEAGRRHRGIGLWLAAAATMALAVTGTWMVATRSAAGDDLAREVLASHVRSLMPGHLTDVTSNDTHNVKPWFNGKLDFSPPAPNPEPDSTPLIGGRLDYVGGRPVAALVYRRRLHLINVFVWPGTGSARETARQGYNLIQWSAEGWEWWAVSDLNGAELRGFVGKVRSGG